MHGPLSCRCMAPKFQGTFVDPEYIPSAGYMTLWDGSIVSPFVAYSAGCLPAQLPDMFGVGGSINVLRTKSLRTHLPLLSLKH